MNQPATKNFKIDIFFNSIRRHGPRPWLDAVSRHWFRKAKRAGRRPEGASLDSDRQLRDQQILNLMADLLVSNVQKNEKAFDSLCLCFNPQDIEFIYNQLTHRRGREGRYWLIRYLAVIQCPGGFKKLFTLLEDGDESTREAACLGVKKIVPGVQVAFLVKQLHSAKRDVVCFAIHQLGELKARPAVKSLLSLLAESKDEYIQTAILEALAKIKDVRALERIEEFTYSSHHKVQQAAFLAMGAFASLASAKVINRCQTSNNAEVRRIAYLSGLRFGGVSAEKSIVEGLTHEKDERLKMDILVALRAIKSHPLFLKILNLAIDDPSVSIRTMARSVLRRVKSQRILKWLREKLRTANGGRREWLLRLLVDYSQDVFIQREFRKILACSPDPVSRLIALEALSGMDSLEIRQLLVKIIKEDNPFSYAAAISLSRVLTLEHGPVVDDMLSLDIRKMSPIIQIFLNFLLCLPDHLTLPPTTADHVKRLLNTEDNSIRFLAVKCYARTNQETRLQEYFRLVTTDKEANIRNVAFQEMVSFLNNDPQGLISLLTWSLKASKSFSLTHRLFKIVYAREKEILQLIINSLLDLINYYQTHPQEGRMLDDVRLMSLVRSLIGKEQALFLDLLRGRPWTDRNLLLLLKILNTTPLDRLSTMDIDFMAEQFNETAKEIKCEFLKIFANLPTRSPAIEEIIFKSLTAEEDVALRKEITSTLKAWVARSLTYTQDQWRQRIMVHQK